VASAIAGGLLLPTGHAFAQTSPPIEQRGEEPPDEGIDVIEPELTPTISPDQDSTAIIEDVEGSGNVRYFAETGHNLDEPFLSPWILAGEESGPGIPLSEPRFVADDGTIRQDFEALAFVYNPNLEEGQTLQSAPLPNDLVNRIATAQSRSRVDSCDASDQTCEFFAESGHTISGPIAAFWDAHGGYQVLGLPLSEQFSSGGKTTQVFERVVVDEDASGQVSMRKVNVDLASKTFADDAAFRPAPPTLGTTSLVAAEDGLRLRSGPDANATAIAVLPNNAEFIAAPGAHESWIPGYVDGFSGWVAAEFLTTRGDLPAVSSANWRLDVWEGATLAETNIRRAATTASGSVRTLAYQDPVVVVDWVEGEAVVENQITWAKLDDGSFVYARNIGRAAPVEPPPLADDAPSEGRWIDVHLTQQLMVAYEGRDPVRTVVMTSGQPGWETPTGYFAINARVANETMESGSIGAESFYVLENVLFTQYFSDRGHALHYAWWKTAETIGRPGSHGCLNLLLEDSQFFWDWADIGTPVICRRA
jgi:hypothetical protein